MIVTVSDEVKLTNFASWAKRSVDELRARNKWTMDDIVERIAAGAERTNTKKVAKATLYKWMRGDFADGWPTADRIAAMCFGLSLDITEPYSALGWVSSSRRNPHVLSSEIAQKLDAFIQNPDISKKDKQLITDMILRLITPYES